MSVDLGVHHWKLVGIDDGFALFTHYVLQRSRWVDLRTWPAKVMPPRDEWTRAIGPGAALVGWKQQTVFTYAAVGKQRKEQPLPTKKHGYRALGKLRDKLALVPGSLAMDNHSSPLTCAPAPVVLDGTWRALDGAGGDGALSAIVGDLVIWSGRVLRFDGTRLVETPAGDLPRTATGCAPFEDGFATVAGGKLIVVTRDGKQREDRTVGKLELATVQRYEDTLLLGDRHRYWLYDGGKAEPLDLGGILDPDDVLAAPCGLLALVDQSRRLVRLRV